MGPKGQQQMPGTEEEKKDGLFGGVFADSRRKALLAAGLTLMQQSGPRPQGTGSFGEMLANSAMAGIQTYQSSKEQEKALGIQAMLQGALSDPEIMATLTERQKMLLPIMAASDPGGAMKLLSEDAWSPEKSTVLPGGSQLVDSATGEILAENEPMPKALSFQKLEDGTLVGLNPMTGEQVMSLSAGAQQHQGQKILELQDNFVRRPEAKIWAETAVQLKAAQEAAAAGDGASDLALMIAAAKVLDPTSVVREGEIALQDLAQSKSELVKGTLRQYLTNNGRLSDVTRRNTLGVVERTAAQRWGAFNRTRDNLRPIYEQMGVDSDLVFGGWESPTYVTITGGGPRAVGAGIETTVGGPSVNYTFGIGG